MARFNIAAKGKGFSQGSNTVRAIEGILTDYKRFVGVVEEETERILDEASNMVLDAARANAPEETGALKESGRAGTRKNERGIFGYVSFGGLDAPVTPTKNAPKGIVDYAVVVHEDANHSGYKFMEEAALNVKDEVDAYITSQLKKVEP